MKLLPTIHLSCPIAFKGWVNLRKMLVDYGKTYRIRGEFNVSLMVLIALS